MPDFVEKNYIPVRSAVSASRVDPSAGLAHGQHLRGIHVTRGDVSRLPFSVRSFVETSASLCQPDAIHICDGSETEQAQLLRLLEDQGTITRLPKYDNCWLARTDPADVARVESRTFICTEKREEAVPRGQAIIGSSTTALGNWINPNDMDKAISERFPGCMQGRTMYVIPFSMGPIGSPLSKLAVEVTDSAYVAASMRIMTRSGDAALKAIENEGGRFVKCLHSVGRRRDGQPGKRGWPCDPERTIILHRPAANEIVSYGSGYGGNSLLGKKCLALRLGSTLARDEGWLAEHMLIVGIKRPNGKQRYIAAAFPSACGKTNLAMLCPTLPGYEVTCVGDDIAWLRVDPVTGQLRAINPENGFFGVAPGTSNKTNPHAMSTMFKNTMFTNVASTSDGGVFWEGMEDEIDPNVTITDWQGKPWDRATSKTPAAHPNSRFCSPASQCPIIDEAWQDPAGVPIDAILFGGRRPAGVPLVLEARDWAHGVFLGASLRSEATAAAEHKGKIIMHDPFAMRPFFGYNFGRYLAHWLSFQSRDNVQLPKIFQVNWFRKNQQGKFLWPGFGENSRVIDWILRRIDGETNAIESPVGLLPLPGTLNIQGLKENVDFEELFRVPKEFWQSEVESIGKYFQDQVGQDLPPQVAQQLNELKQRVEAM